MKNNSIQRMFLNSVKDLSAKCNSFSVDDDTVTVYNPLDYAIKPLSVYVEKYLNTSAEIILLGMNPGPFGMAQTGIPFGDVKMVRDWMGIEGKVEVPNRTHPKRPIDGFSCLRSEVSGTRLWSWARERYDSPGNFFSKFFVWNYCPLVFMEEGGANKTPNKLTKEKQAELFSICDRTLDDLVSLISPDMVIGVGQFAYKRAENAVGDRVKTGSILHPSPASPRANKDWKGEIEKQLADYNVSFG